MNKITVENGSYLFGEYIKYLETLKISGDEEIFLFFIAKRTIMFLNKWAFINRKDFHKYFGENKRKKLKRVLSEKELLKYKSSSINGQRAYEKYSIVINDAFWSKINVSWGLVMKKEEIKQEEIKKIQNKAKNGTLI